MCNLGEKMIQKNLLTKRNTLTDIENKFMITKGEDGIKLEVWD